jgi:hypothetical protein
MSHLKEILKIADIHCERIKTALYDLRDLFPLNAFKIENLQKEDLLLLELLTSRFAKLQDLMGSKIIGDFLNMTGDARENMTMLDKIHLLERLEIIDDSELWKEMRNVRNNISHEYPDEPGLTADYLNKVFELAPKLLELYTNIKNKTETILSSET